MGCGCRRRRHSCGRCGGFRDFDGGFENCYTTKHWKKVCKCVPFHRTVCEAPAFDGFGDDDYQGHRHRHHHCHKKC